MANFGVEATQLSAPDTRAAKFVRQPVADTSKNILLGTALDMAGQAVEGYQMASLEREQEKVIDEYMGRRPEAFNEQTIELAALKDSVDSIWEKAGSVEEIESSADPVEQEFRSRLDKFNKAKEQGVMSPSDFQTRILATTREAVNRSPGLYDKLLQHSKKVLGLSGIESVLDADIAKQKAQDDSLKNLRELADKLNVDYNHFAPDYGDMQNRVRIRQQQISASEELDRGIKADAALTKEDAKAWVANQGTNLVAGDTFLLTRNASVMFAEATPQDYPKIKAKLRLDATERHNAFVAKTNQLGIRNDPTTAALIEDHKKTLDYVLETIDGLESGADAEKALTHAYNIIEKTQELGLAKRYNIGAMNLMKKIPEAVWTKLLVTPGSENLTKLMTLSQDIFNEAVSSPMAVDSLSTYSSDPANPEAVIAGIGIVDGTKDEGELATNSSKVLNFFHSGMQDGNFKTEEDKVKYLDSVFKQLADPKRKDKLKFAYAQAQANAFKMTDEYFQTVGTWREKKFNEALTDDIAVYADVLPDGRLTFRSSDPKTQAEFNSKFATRINDGIGAMSNLMGISRSEATTTILPRYRQIFGVETNIQTGPKEITQPYTKPSGELAIHTRAQAAQALRDKRIDQAQYNAIIRSMVEEDIR
jgi:hypothetical protein